ncbi:MAG: ABC transporter permease [Sphingobacteriia bacterium]|nr:ABC transporter permease [Sphingobacteriia bacterium]
MNKILLIISREYLTRVKKKSFIIMTILGPLLMAAIMIVPIFIAKMSDERSKIIVLDENGLFLEKLESNPDINFSYTDEYIEDLKNNYEKRGYDGILYIPKNSVPNRAYIFSQKQLGLGVKSHVQNTMKYTLDNYFMQQMYNINRDSIKAIEQNTRIMLEQRKIGKDGEEEKSSTELSTVLGILAGIIIYFFIFMFGSQVMRGVIEEKTSRIVEVIVSSVKPFELMMGKIIGIAFVGLTQFLLWVILTFSIITMFKTTMPEYFETPASQTAIQQNPALANLEQMNGEMDADKSPEVTKIIDTLKTIDFTTMILMFLFYFMAGYLFYASFFAAIGSAVDNEADTQQFILPITIPLIFAIIMAQFITNSPNGAIAFWLSIIPFTSPIIMMVRIPFGVPIEEIILSMALLVAAFIFSTWFAAKIYRTGILMYGKKPSYQELLKWLKYKN